MFYATNVMRRLSKSISSRFGVIHSYNARRSRKSQKKSLKTPILGV